LEAQLLEAQLLEAQLLEAQLLEAQLLEAQLLEARQLFEARSAARTVKRLVKRHSPQNTSPTHRLSKFLLPQLETAVTCDIL
jgi:hypothetical protein